MNLSNEGIPSVSIGNVISVVLRRKWVMLATFSFVLGGAAGITLWMPKTYAAHMKVLVKNERADTIVSAERSGSPMNPGEVSEAQINTEIELLNGSNLLEQVVIKTGLAQRERRDGPSAGEPAEVLTERAVLRLQRDLKIAAVRKADIIQVDYESTHPQLAVNVLRQLADSYLEAHLKVHSTPGTYDFFQSQANRYLLELKDAESKLAEFRQRLDIVLPTQQKDMMLRQAADAESALIQTETLIGELTDKISNTGRQLRGAEPRIVTLSRTVPNQYSVERLHTMLAELQNRRTQLLAKFRSDDRLVLEADQEIVDTQGALERATKLNALEQATDVNPTYQALEIELSKEQAEVAGLETRRQALARQARTYRQRLMKVSGATARDDDLVRTQKETEDNYLLYARKAEEARIAESLDKQKIANVAIAETPTEPRLPAKPNVLLNISIGAVLAIFLSIISAFIAEYFDDIVRNREDLEELTGLPVLASLSSIAFRPVDSNGAVHEEAVKSKAAGLR